MKKMTKKISRYDHSKVSLGLSAFVAVMLISYGVRHDVSARLECTLVWALDIFFPYSRNLLGFRVVQPKCFNIHFVMSV